MATNETYNPYAATEVQPSEATSVQKPWKEIARRWEKRRIWFNVVLLILGVIALVFAVGANAIFYIPGAVLFGIAANTCYTFGPMAEMYVNWFVDAFEERIPAPVCVFVRSGRFFSIAYFLGLLFSAMVVLSCGLWFAIGQAFPKPN